MSRIIGDKQFYKQVILLTLPIMIQNFITNFVNMLDNVMVGQVGTVEMTGVAVTNQLLFVFNLCVFGAVSGVGIFGAQFFGKKDAKGLRYTLRAKLIFIVFLSISCIILFLTCGDKLISLYLTGKGSAADAAASLRYARQYLNIMLIGLLPYALVQCYSSTMRETSQTTVPMVAGVVAVLVNLGLNYVLIFGHFGLPRMGVIGAAIATVISRFAELAIVAVWVHSHKERNEYAVGLYRSLRIPLSLTWQIVVKGFPLMANETLWAVGVAMVNQALSLRGLDVIAADNIAQTFSNVFSVAFQAVGVAIGILLGQLLGAREYDKAKESSWKLISFSVFVSIIMGAIFFICAEFIPAYYNTEDNIRTMSTILMQIAAVAMPVEAFANACYFTIRSGGKSMVTFLFDSCFVLAVSLPVTTILCRYTSLSIYYVYAIYFGLYLVKDLIGFLFVKYSNWARIIVSRKA